MARDERITDELLRISELRRRTLDLHLRSDMLLLREIRDVEVRLIALHARTEIERLAQLAAALGKPAITSRLEDRLRDIALTLGIVKLDAALAEIERALLQKAPN